MIEGLKPYAAYKDSGQDWLGRMPAHWNVRRTKLLLREMDSRSTTGKEQLLRVSQYTGVTRRKSIDGIAAPDTRAASLVGYKRVSANDLVVNIMLAWNGSLLASPYDGIVSPAYYLSGRFRRCLIRASVRQRRHASRPGSRATLVVDRQRFVEARSLEIGIARTHGAVSRSRSQCRRSCRRCGTVAMRNGCAESIQG